MQTVALNSDGQGQLFDFLSALAADMGKGGRKA